MKGGGGGGGELDILNLIVKDCNVHGSYDSAVFQYSVQYLLQE